MAKHHVLIIEDDRSLSDVLSYNLEQAGYAVSVAHDGQDGLNQAQHKTPDVIVLDLMLPVIDGLEVCRLLLSEAQVRMAGPRTVVGDAIGLAINVFEESELDDRVLIALTDGNDTGSRIPPDKAATVARDRGITIHTVAVGDPSAAGEEQLDEEAMSEVRRKALELEKHAYSISQDVYAHTPPAQPDARDQLASGSDGETGGEIDMIHGAR